MIYEEWILPADSRAFFEAGKSALSDKEISDRRVCY